MWEKIGRLARLLCDGTNLRKGAEVKGDTTLEWVSPLRGPPTQKPTNNSEVHCLPLISVVREYGLLH
jgi:hypothetical protein